MKFWIAVYRLFDCIFGSPIEEYENSAAFLEVAFEGGKVIELLIHWNNYSPFSFRMAFVAFLLLIGIVVMFVAKKASS